MNWHKAKTILIIFFLCTNLFLLAMILTSTSQSMILTDDIVSSTVTILTNNRIEIDEELIPRKTTLIPSVTMQNVITEYPVFAKTVLGDDAVMTETGKYKGSAGAITFRGDFFELIADAPLSASVTKSQDAEAEAKKLLSGFGFDFSQAEISVSGEYDFTVNFSQKANHLPVFRSELEVVFEPDGIKRISGCWFQNEKIEREKPEIKSVASVLLDFVTLSNRPATPDKIIGLEFGYGIPTDAIYHNSITLYPAWSILLDTQEEYIMNAQENI
ncbi:MAG: hypothetical protein E7397_02380 [Ruminococcaceae bacterium]|nr:hypothetical protein [Oscillospiraceae bacterium]